MCLRDESIFYCICGLKEQGCKAHAIHSYGELPTDQQVHVLKLILAVWLSVVENVAVCLSYVMGRRQLGD